VLFASPHFSFILPKLPQFTAALRIRIKLYIKPTNWDKVIKGMKPKLKRNPNFVLFFFSILLFWL
jgi:hypothetical protein